MLKFLFLLSYILINNDLKYLIPRQLDFYDVESINSIIQSHELIWDDVNYQMGSLLFDHQSYFISKHKDDYQLNYFKNNYNLIKTMESYNLKEIMERLKPIKILFSLMIKNLILFSIVNSKIIINLYDIFETKSWKKINTNINMSKKDKLIYSHTNENTKGFLIGINYEDNADSYFSVSSYNYKFNITMWQDYYNKDTEPNKKITILELNESQDLNLVFIFYEIIENNSNKLFLRVNNLLNGMIVNEKEINFCENTKINNSKHFRGELFLLITCLENNLVGYIIKFSSESAIITDSIKIESSNYLKLDKIEFKSYFILLSWSYKSNLTPVTKNFGSSQKYWNTKNREIEHGIMLFNLNLILIDFVIDYIPNLDETFLFTAFFYEDSTIYPNYNVVYYDKKLEIYKFKRIDADSIFLSNLCSAKNCKKCSFYDMNYCLECKLDSKVEYIAINSKCNVKTDLTKYYGINFNDNIFYYKCHHSCKKCDIKGDLNSRFNCNGCDENYKEFIKEIGFENINEYENSKKGGCYCNNITESLDTCKSSCDHSYNSLQYYFINQIDTNKKIYYKCTYDCPENSEKFFSIIDQIDSDTYPIENIYAKSLLNISFLDFFNIENIEKNKNNFLINQELNLNLANKILKIENSFSAGFWVYINDYDSSRVINLYNIVEIKFQRQLNNNFKIILKIINNNNSPFIITSVNILNKKWYYFYFAVNNNNKLEANIFKVTNTQLIKFNFEEISNFNSENIFRNQNSIIKIDRWFIIKELTIYNVFLNSLYFRLNCIRHHNKMKFKNNFMINYFKFNENKIIDKSLNTQYEDLNPNNFLLINSLWDDMIDLFSAIDLVYCKKYLEIFMPRVVPHSIIYRKNINNFKYIYFANFEVSNKEFFTILKKDDEFIFKKNSCNLDDDTFGGIKMINNYIYEYTKNLNFLNLDPGTYYICHNSSKENKKTSKIFKKISVQSWGNLESNFQEIYFDINNNLFKDIIVHTSYYTNKNDKIIVYDDCDKFNEILIQNNFNIPQNNKILVTKYKYNSLSIDFDFNNNFNYSYIKSKICILPYFSNIGENQYLPFAFNLLNSTLNIKTLKNIKFSFFPNHLNYLKENILYKNKYVYKLITDQDRDLNQSNFGENDELIFTTCNKDAFNRIITDHNICEDKDKKKQKYKIKYIYDDWELIYIPNYVEEGYYCLCYKPFINYPNKLRFNYKKLLTNIKDEIIRFRIINFQNNEYANILKFYPGNNNIVLSKDKQYPYIQFDKPIFFSTDSSTNNNIILIKQIFDDSCFDENNNICFLKDEEVEVIYNDSVDWEEYYILNQNKNSTKYFEIENDTIFKIKDEFFNNLNYGFYILKIGNNILKDKSEWINVFDNLELNYLFFNFTLDDISFNLDYKNNIILGKNKEIKIKGNYFKKKLYTSIVDNKIKELTLDTEDIILKLFILNSTNNLCNYFNNNSSSLKYLIKNVTQTEINVDFIEIEDNEKKNCINGDIYMNITYSRVLYTKNYKKKFNKNLLKNLIHIAIIGCKKNCKYCSLEDQKCIICKDNYYFYKNECYNINYKFQNLTIVDNVFYNITNKIETHNTFTTKCKIGYYIDINTKNNCEKCFEFCENCIGKEYDQCTKCKYGYFFLNNICFSKCPIGLENDILNRKCILKDLKNNSTEFNINLNLENNNDGIWFPLDLEVYLSISLFNNNFLNNKNNKLNIQVYNNTINELDQNIMFHERRENIYFINFFHNFVNILNWDFIYILVNGSSKNNYSYNIIKLKPILRPYLDEINFSKNIIVPNLNFKIEYNINNRFKNNLIIVYASINNKNNYLIPFLETDNIENIENLFFSVLNWNSDYRNNYINLNLKVMIISNDNIVNILNYNLPINNNYNKMLEEYLENFTIKLKIGFNFLDNDNNIRYKEVLKFMNLLFSFNYNIPINNPKYPYCFYNQQCYNIGICKKNLFENKCFCKINYKGYQCEFSLENYNIIESYLRSLLNIFYKEVKYKPINWKMIVKISILNELFSLNQYFLDYIGYYLKMKKMIKLIQNYWENKFNINLLTNEIIKVILKNIDILLNYQLNRLKEYNIKYKIDKNISHYKYKLNKSKYYKEVKELNNILLSFNKIISKFLWRKKQKLEIEFENFNIIFNSIEGNNLFSYTFSDKHNNFNLKFVDNNNIKDNIHNNPLIITSIIYKNIVFDLKKQYTYKSWIYDFYLYTYDNKIIDFSKLENQIIISINKKSNSILKNVKCGQWNYFKNIDNIKEIKQLVDIRNWNLTKDEMLYYYNFTQTSDNFYTYVDVNKEVKINKTIEFFDDTLCHTINNYNKITCSCKNSNNIMILQSWNKEFIKTTYLYDVDRKIDLKIYKPFYLTWPIIFEIFLNILFILFLVYMIKEKKYYQLRKDIIFELGKIFILKDTIKYIDNEKKEVEIKDSPNIKKKFEIKLNKNLNLNDVKVPNLRKQTNKTKKTIYENIQDDDDEEKLISDSNENEDINDYFSFEGGDDNDFGVKNLEIDKNLSVETENFDSLEKNINNSNLKEITPILNNKNKFNKYKKIFNFEIEENKKGLFKNNFYIINHNLKNKIIDKITDFNVQIKELLELEILPEKFEDIIKKKKYKAFEIINQLVNYKLNFDTKNRYKTSKIYSLMEVIIYSNVIMRLYTRERSFITPKYIKLTSLFINIYIHIIIHMLIFSYYSFDYIKSDNNWFYFYDINFIFPSLVALLIACIFNFIIDKTMKYNETKLNLAQSILDYENLKIVIETNIDKQNYIIFIFYILFSFINILWTYQFINKFGQEIGMVALWSSIFSFILDNIVLDIFIYLFLLSIKRITFLYDLILEIKKTRIQVNDKLLLIKNFKNKIENMKNNDKKVIKSNKFNKKIIIK